MPFVCETCGVRCLYVPTGGDRKCSACKEMSVMPTADSKPLTPRDHAIAAQSRLFPCAILECNSRGASLPDICLQIRMSIRGEIDRMPDDELQEVYEMLRARAETWREPSDIIDMLVKQMILEACILINQEQRYRLVSV